MLPSTAERVPANTSDLVNEEIRWQTEVNVTHYMGAGAEEIDRRLRELDQEWDTERWLETLAPSFTLTGLLLGVTVSRKWLILPFVVQAFFLQHALQGWCPPLPLLRRMGVRTSKEIEQERQALQAMQMSNQGMDTGCGDRAERALQAAER
ncbi:MAG TPA: hypothetical protein VKS79_26350 [Gemmataceae bacterium]|nr:hypothetical protein [Gemmataceae bacterium]